MTLTYPSLGFRRGKYKTKPKSDILIVHTTGGGVIRRFLREPRRWSQDPFETALWIYGNIMTAGPHYVVGGRRAELVCPLTHAAHHVGVNHKTGKSPHKYARDGWAFPKYKWWLDGPGQEFGAKSPLELPGQPWGSGKRLSCNMRCDGLEIVPSIEDPTMRGPISDVTMEVVLDIARQYKYVYSHSEVHPLSRTSNRGQAWDVPQHVMKRLRDYLSCPF